MISKTIWFIWREALVRIIPEMWLLKNRDGRLCGVGRVHRTTFSFVFGFAKLIPVFVTSKLFNCNNSHLTKRVLDDWINCAHMIWLRHLFEMYSANTPHAHTHRCPKHCSRRFTWQVFTWNFAHQVVHPSMVEDKISGGYFAQDKRKFTDACVRTHSHTHTHTHTHTHAQRKSISCCYTLNLSWSW